MIGYIDFNRNGVFDSDEKMFDVENCTPTDQTQYVYSQNFQVPSNAVPGPTYARFRIERRCDDIHITGPSDLGEVEDYKVIIEEPGSHEYDFGDAPASAQSGFANSYPLLGMG